MTSPRPRIVVTADPTVLARAVVDHFVTIATLAITLRNRFDVALAGGTTPKAAYGLLAGPFREAVDWSKVRFFFSDERCVHSYDELSNYRMARETLLDPLHVEDQFVFRMRGEDNPKRAALEYAEVLRTELGALGPAPIFDLIMLGMGPDGHTASLFPGSDPLEDDDLLVRAVRVKATPPDRLTLTPRVINAAREVVIATEGLAKAPALAAVLEGPHDYLKLPIQLVRPHDGNLTWFVDRAAAAGLSA